MGDMTSLDPRLEGSVVVGEPDLGCGEPVGIPLDGGTEVTLTVLAVVGQTQEPSNIPAKVRLL